MKSKIRGVLIAGAFASAASTSAIAQSSAGASTVAWTGFYVGLNAGATLAATNTVNHSASGLIDYPTGNVFQTIGGPISLVGGYYFPSSSSARSVAGAQYGANGLGVIAGGQAGYNFQVAPSWIGGAEIDLQATPGRTVLSDVNGVLDPSFLSTLGNYGPFTSSRTSSRGTLWLGSARARIGYLLHPSLLTYVTGGAAMGGVRLSTSYASTGTGAGPGGGAFCGACIFGPAFGTAQTSQVRLGWIVGAGAEFSIAQNWSARLEYSYYDLGAVATPYTTVIGATNVGQISYAYGARASTRFNGHIVRVGVNYHWN